MVVLWCDTYNVISVLFLPRYRRFRQAAFANCGALLTTTGILDDSVAIKRVHNFHPPPPGSAVYDDSIMNHSWTAASEFVFSSDPPGRHEDVEPDSSARNISSSSTDADDSSSGMSAVAAEQ
jgi:hypothetical protein